LQAQVIQSEDSANIRQIQDSIKIPPTSHGKEKDIIPEIEGAKERRLKERINLWEREALDAIKRRDYKEAEPLFLQILSFDITPEKRRSILLEMSDLYEKTKEPAKQAAVLEKFCDAYQDDPETPQVYIKLGMLYRDLGLYKLAFARFYSVLNFSLRIDQSRIGTYRKLSVRAQMEIADTHFMMGSYAEATKFYNKLRLLSLEPEENAHAIFQTAYSHYLLKEYSLAAPAFQTFVTNYPQDGRMAEAMFLLADSYVRINKHTEATQTVLQLLKHQREATMKEKDEKEWIRWQKKAGNELANDLFEQNDYAGALSMYQSMLSLGNEPDWCWPVMYQMGVCLEHLSLGEKAKQMYKMIVEWPDRNGAKTEALKNASLAETYDMAKWRLNNIGWQNDTDNKLQKILDKAH